MTKTPIERFTEKVAEPYDAHNDCFEWKGAKSTLGYGVLWMKGKQQYAHRLSYQFFVSPIPEGTEIDHLCRNPSCVRPDHLEAVSHAVNMQRGEGNGLKHLTHCKQGHLFDEVNTYRDPATGSRKCRACMKEATVRWRNKKGGY